MTRFIGIYGASGFGREVLPIARHLADKQTASLVFIDDSLGDGWVNDVRVMSWHDFRSTPGTDKAVALAIASSSVRERLATQCREASIALLELRHPSVVVMDYVTLGDGAILSPFVILTSNVRIGRCFHANLYSYVAHDCVIGDFVTFAPRVCCNGNVHIHDHAYIGTGAVLRQGTPDKPLVIGRGAVIGMGAVVTKDVPAGATVVGNPARPLVKD